VNGRSQPTREDRYWRAIDRGASHEEALAFADNQPARPAAPAPTPPPAPARPSALAGFSRGAAQGIRDTAASYAGGASWLTGGEGTGVGRALAGTEAAVAGGWEPQTTAEKTGKIVGRIGSELAGAMTIGGALVRGATAVPRLSRLASALQSSNRITRGTAYAATQAPLDIVMGARDETPLLLPDRFGRPGAIAENIAITGAAGALFAPLRKARAAQETPPRQAPPAEAPRETPRGAPREVPRETPQQQVPREAPEVPTPARTAETDPVKSVLEERPATYRKKDGTIKFGFEDSADAAAWILATKRKNGAEIARKYLEDIGMSSEQIADYISSVGAQLRREAREFVFDAKEKGTTVFYYVPRIGPPDVPIVRPSPQIDALVPPAGVPAAAVTPGASASAAQAAPEALGVAETTFRSVIPEEAIRRGAQTAVRSATGESVPAVSYAIVDASQVLPSHSPRTFAWNEAYPKSMQQRDYSKIQAYQDAVNRRSSELDPDFLTDLTRGLQDGPPLVSSTGLVIAGNDRTMSIMRAMSMFPAKYANYVRRLEEAAPTFGLSADAVKAVDNPILVRVVDEPLDVGRMQNINRTSDVTDTKSLSGRAEARSRSQVFAGATRSIEHFARTIDADETIRGYLSTSNGRRFVDLLTEEGVIPRPRLAELMSENNTSMLSASGRDYIARLITSTALRNADELPDQILNKIEHATPVIAKLKSVPDWDVSGVVEEAVDILARARSADLSLDAFVTQRGMFDEGDVVFSQLATDIARFIDSSSKRKVSDAFRNLGKIADESYTRGAGGAQDMFGEVAKVSTLDDALKDIFGATAKVSAAVQPVAARAVSAVEPVVETVVSDFVLPKNLQGMSPNYRSHTIQFGNDLDRAAYTIANDAARGKASKSADSIMNALESQGFAIDEVVLHGVTNVIPALKRAANQLKEGDKIVLESLQFGTPARTSVTRPEIASAVAGAALGGAAGSMAGEEGDAAQAGLGTFLGGVLGGALGRSAGRRIADDAGLIARGRRSRPKPQTFLGEVSKGKGILAETSSRFRYNVVQETHPVLLLARHTLGKKAAERLDGMISRSQGSAQEAMQYMRDNYDSFFNGYTRDQQDSIAQFAIIRRAAESGLSINMAPEEVIRRYDEGMADPLLKEGSDQLMKYFRDLLKMRYRAGLISDADYTRIVQSDDFYVPFAAEFAAESRRKAAREAPGWNIRNTGVGSMNREAIRDWNIQDPLEVLAEATLATHADVAKQRAFNLIARSIDKAAIDLQQGVSKIGDFIYRVNPNSKGAFEANRFTAITKGGKRVTYEVRDPELFQAIAQQNKLSQNIAMELARKIAAFKRASIVLEPTFSLMQSIRDVPFYVAQRQDFGRALRESAMGSAAGAVGGAVTSSEEDDILYNSISGALIGTGAGAIARPAVDIMRALKSVVGNDEAYKEWLRMGGSSESIRITNPSDAQEVLRRLRNSGVNLNDVIVPKRWVDSLRFIAAAGEQVPRLAKYQEQIARGVDPSVAVRDSQAVTVRFANKGANKAIKELASITPFFSAKIAGWDKLAQMAKDPKQSALAGLVLTAPTVGLFMQNKDNPEYWDRPQWEKDLFWLVPKPEGGFYRVPKPFELGYLFSSLPERYMNYLAETGQMESAAPRRNVTGSQAFSRAARTFALDPIAESVPIPTAVEVPLSQAMNYDFFRRRDLVPQYYQRIEPREQALPYTGALPRAVGQATGLSPIRVEKALSDIGGTGYRRFSEAIADPILRRADMDAPVQRARDMGTGPAVIRTTGLSRFIARDYDATQVEADARDRLRKIEEKHQTLQMMRNQRRPIAEVNAYRDQNSEDLRARQALNNMRIELDRVTAERRDIMRRRDLTPEQRDRRMDTLKARGDAVSRRIVEYGVR